MLRLQLVPVLADLGVESVGREVVKSGGRLRRYRSRQELHAYRPRRLAFFHDNRRGAHDEAHQRNKQVVATVIAQQQSISPRRPEGNMAHRLTQGNRKSCIIRFGFSRTYFGRGGGGTRLSGWWSQMLIIAVHTGDRSYRAQTGSSFTRRRRWSVYYAVLVLSIRQQQRLSERLYVQQCRLNMREKLPGTDEIPTPLHALSGLCQQWLGIASSFAGGQTQHGCTKGTEHSTLLRLRDRLVPRTAVMLCCRCTSHNNDCPMCGGCLLPIAQFCYHPPGTRLPYYLGLTTAAHFACSKGATLLVQQGGGDGNFVCRFPILSNNKAASRC